MESTSATASSAPQVQSLLTKLKCPVTSELARKRKVATKMGQHHETNGSTSETNRNIT